MSTWYTADLHLGHANIVRYAERPFATVGEHDAFLVAAWNARVAPGDEVWVLGDVALGSLGRTLPLVRELAGVKHLIAGNHDRCWSGNREFGRGREAVVFAARRDRAVERYLEAGFVDVADRGSVVLPGEVTLCLSHFPYTGDSHGTDRYQEWRPVDEGGWLAHGHTHSRTRVRGRQLHVGVDAWGYRPVAEAELAALVTP